MAAEPMSEARLVCIEQWMQSHEQYWASQHAGAGIDSLVDYTQDLIAEVRRLREENQQFTQDVRRDRFRMNMSGIPPIAPFPHGMEP